MKTPLSLRAGAQMSPVVHSRPSPSRTGVPRDPLEHLRALARQDLSTVERVQVEQEIHTWEQQKRLQEWRNRHRPSTTGE